MKRTKLYPHETNPLYSVRAKLQYNFRLFKFNSLLHPLSSLVDWHPGITVEGAQYWLYMVQMGLYLHCAYATLYLETIRRDFFVLMLHHILTLALLFFSFIVR